MLAPEFRDLVSEHCHRCREGTGDCLVSLLQRAVDFDE